MQRTVQNAVTHNEGDTVWNSIHAMPPSKLFRPWDYTSIHLYFSELVSDSFVLLRFIFNPDLLFL